jgi:hypothetical protein
MVGGGVKVLCEISLVYTGKRGGRDMESFQSTT